ncbi:hypothetical protein EDB84DRAFT_818340 [Lactarius hengduanensis]|nr:hypothetical protein EDB84DRAFT_818340 [Lactarius hengduanensis]
MGTHSHYQVFLPSFGEPFLSISFPNGDSFYIPSDSSPATPGAASHIRKTGQGRRKKQKNIRAQGKNYGPGTMIDMLPDDVLLEIFDLCQERYSFLDAIERVWGWHFFVHVCRRWRQIIFESPHRLNLRIFCTQGTPVRKNLVLPNDEDNVVAALEHPDRVSLFQAQQ